MLVLRLSVHNKLKLCFVADDYSESKETNRAIEDVCTGNVVRSISIVASESSVYSDFLFKPDKDITLGIHLYLSDYIPLTTQMKTFSKKGKTINKSNIVFGLMTGKIPLRHIYEEFDAQIVRLRELGHQPRFIDTHQNIHSFPLIFRVVRQIAAKYGMENNIRPFAQLDFCRKRTWRSFVSWAYAVAVNFRRRSRVLVGCPGYREKAINISQVLNDWDRFLFEVTQKGYDEIFVPCHPGISPAEVDLYSSPDFLELIRKHQIYLAKGD